MRSIRLPVCRLLNFYFLICVWSCRNNGTNYPGESKKLLDLEREAITREFQNDTAFLSSIMDSTFIELTKKGTKNKHEVLKTIYRNNIENRQSKISLDSFLLEDSIVHLYGNTAVVTFILHTFRKNDDSLFERRTRFYDVWVKRDEKWKAVTWQASPVE